HRSRRAVQWESRSRLTSDEPAVTSSQLPVSSKRLLVTGNWELEAAGHRQRPVLRPSIGPSPTLAILAVPSSLSPSIFPVNEICSIEPTSGISQAILT